VEIELAYRDVKSGQRGICLIFDIPPERLIGHPDQNYDAQNE
jgi:hypothetical protein